MKYGLYGLLKVTFASFLVLALVVLFYQAAIWFFDPITDLQQYTNLVWFEYVAVWTINFLSYFVIVISLLFAAYFLFHYFDEIIRNRLLED